MFKRRFILLLSLLEGNTHVVISKCGPENRDKNKHLFFIESSPSWPGLRNQGESSKLSSRPARSTAAMTVEPVSAPSFSLNTRPQLHLQTRRRFVYVFPSESGCYGFFCYYCLGCSIASDMDECCLCGLGMPIRSVYRTKYNIKVSSQWTWGAGSPVYK